MKDLVINALEVLCKIGVVLTLCAGVGAGILVGSPFIALAGLVIAFILSVVVFGFLFLLIDINENLRQLRYTVEKKQ